MKVVSSLKSLKKRDINNNVVKRQSKIYFINKKYDYKKENFPNVRNTKVAGVNYGLKNWCVNVVDLWANQLELQQIYDISLSEINTDIKVDSLIVAVSHNEFGSKSPDKLRSFCKESNPVLVEIKSIHKRKDLIPQGFSVFQL